MNSPCMNCTQRQLHCHSSCPAYAEYRNKIDNAKSEALKELEWMRFKCDIKRTVINKKLKKEGAFK